MKKIYTAIGQMQLRGGAGGKRFPVLVLNGEEITPDMGEMILWSTLYWQFLTEKELEYQYGEKKNEMRFSDKRSCERVMFWLLRRGLLAEGIGETYEDALYDLVSGLYITPISESRILAAGTFLKMIFSDRLPFGTAKQVFRRDKRSDSEKKLMKIINRVRLSSAEVIRCIERNILDIKHEDEIVEKLYSDDYTTDQNISDEMRSSPVCRQVLSDVANLYLRRQLIFDKK